MGEEIYHKAEENMNKLQHGIKKFRKHFFFETRDQIRLKKKYDKRREDKK